MKIGDSFKILSGEEQHRNMLETPIPKLVSKMALPMIVLQLISIIYNTVDTFFVSKISNGASAAVGVVFSLMSLIQAFGGGIGMGAGSIISRHLGAKKLEAAERIASSACIMAMIAGTLVASLGLFFLTPLMKLFGSTDVMLPHTTAYARFILIAAPANMLGYSLSIVFRSEGEAKVAMIASVSGGLLNVALDPLFIFGLGMGTGGAGLATGISQTLTLAILILFILRKKSIIIPTPKKISGDFREYLEILKTGLPTIARQGLASLSTALLTRSAAVFSVTKEEAIAGVNIANKIYLLIRNVILGIGQGLQPVAGYNYGAGDRARTKRAFWFATLVGTVISVAAGVVIAISPETFIRFFRDDPDIVNVGRTALLFVACILPFLAFSTYVNQLYQCLGFKAAATFLACCRQGICFLPLVFLLPRLFGITGVEMTQPGADFLTFLISVPFLIFFMKKHLKTDGKAA